MKNIKGRGSSDIAYRVENNEEFSRWWVVDLTGNVVLDDNLTLGDAGAACRALNDAQGDTVPFYGAAERMLRVAEKLVKRIQAANDDKCALLASAHEHIRAARHDLDDDQK